MVISWQSKIRKNDVWLLSFLKKHKVPFIIFGGAAVAYHGCRDEFHFDDIDVLLCPTAAHSAKFALAMNAAATAAGKNVATSFPRDFMAQLDVKYNVDAVQFHIDFVTMLKPQVFNDLRQNAVSARIGLMEVKVVCLEDMIKLKEKGMNDNYSRHNFYAKDADSIRQIIATQVG